MNHYIYVCTECGAKTEVTEGSQINKCPYCGCNFARDLSDFEKKRILAEDKEKIRQNIAKEKSKSDKHAAIWIVSIFGGIILMLLAIILIPHYSKIGYLNRLAEEIRKDIIENRLDEAYMKTLDLSLDDGFSWDEDAKWNRTRKELQNLIKEKQRQ